MIAPPGAPKRRRGDVEARRTGRIWIGHRQAYMPRFWPQLVVLLPITFAISYHTPIYVGVPVAILLGYGFPKLRMKLWERRHPALPIEEIARRTAPWN